MICITKKIHQKWKLKKKEKKKDSWEEVCTNVVANLQYDSFCWYPLAAACRAGSSGRSLGRRPQTQQSGAPSKHSAKTVGNKQQEQAILRRMARI